MSGRVRTLVPKSVKLKLWLLKEALLQPRMRRRLARLPRAKAAADYGVARRRLRGGSSTRTGVGRLDAVTVINLATRPQRLASFEGEMSRLGIRDVTRFDAIAEPDGMLGCARSHAACVERMVAESWSAAMICEDDALFRISRARLDLLVDAFLDDPRAEVACLAYSHLEVEPYSSLFMRSTSTRGTACYILKASIAPDLLALSTEGIGRMERGDVARGNRFDRIWEHLQRERIFLVPIERAAYQGPGYSDIQERHVNYGT